jgi:hypothetical protein
MTRPKADKPPEPPQSDPIESAEFEDAVKEVLLSPKPEVQHSENREPTMEELKQKFKLERRE